MSSSVARHLTGAYPAFGESRGEKSASRDERSVGKSTSGELGDEVLMSHLQRGDLEALEVLFDRYSGLILGVGSRILRDAGEAEDLVQEVFLYLFRRSRLFDSSKGSLRSWLIQATYSRGFNRRKYLKERFFYVQESSQDAARNMADNSVINPEELRQLSYWRSYLRQAFLDLPEEHRATLQLHFFEGYTLIEISQKMGHSLGNVRHYFYRGIQRLRKRLSEDSSPSRKD